MCLLLVFAIIAYYALPINCQPKLKSFDEISDKWNSLFYHIITKSLLFDAQIYEIYDDYDFESMEKTRYPFNNVHDIDNVISDTNLLLKYSDPVNLHNVRWKDILSIQRQAMIIYQFHSSYVSNVSYFGLFDTVKKLHNAHQMYIISQPMLQVHVQKTGGTTICKTFESMGYIVPKYKDHNYNCNIYPSLRDNEKYYLYPGGGEEHITCNEMLDIVKANKYEIIARERPLIGDKDTFIPVLCPQFNYIFSIRHPIDKIVSFMYERRHGIFIKSAPVTSNSIVSASCDLIFQNNSKQLCYVNPTKPDQLLSFLEFLLNSETKDNDIEYKIPKDNVLGTKDAISVNLIDNNYKYLISDVDSVRGQITNNYVRYLGYKHNKCNSAKYQKNKNNVTFCMKSADALREKSWNIGINFFLNSIELMLKIDYILPFRKRFDHGMFDYLLNLMQKKKNILNHYSYFMELVEANKNKDNFTLDNLIKDVHFNQDQTFELKWNHKASSSDSELSSSKIYNILNENEIQLLADKNILDFKLYELSHWVADQDLKLIQYTPISRNNAYLSDNNDAMYYIVLAMFVGTAIIIMVSRKYFKNKSIYQSYQPLNGYNNTI